MPPASDAHPKPQKGAEMWTWPRVTVETTALPAETKKSASAFRPLRRLKPPPFWLWRVFSVWATQDLEVQSQAPATRKVPWVLHSPSGSVPLTGSSPV